MVKVVRTDHEGCLILSGHLNEKFFVCENSDGSILLQPATADSSAQEQYDNDADLRELITQAAASSTIHHNRAYRDTETQQSSKPPDDTLLVIAGDTSAFHMELTHGENGEPVTRGTLRATAAPVYESGDDDELNSDA